MPHTKTTWRRVLIGARSALAPSIRRSRSAAIAERIRAHPTFARTPALLAYEPIGAEVDPTALCASIDRLGRAAFVPAAEQLARWQRWYPDDRNRTARRGTAADEAVDIGDGTPLVVLVPGVGFDMSATRLGRGGGFYDRALAQLRAERPVIAIGLA